MGKKFMNTVLFLAVTVAAATLTAYVGKGSGNVLLYNFTFLGLMLIIYAVGLFAGLYRMDNLSRALKALVRSQKCFSFREEPEKKRLGSCEGFSVTAISTKRWMILLTASAERKKGSLK